MAAGVSNIVLGIWLFLSAFLWPHTSAQFGNTVFVAFLIVLFSVLALHGQRGARYATAGVAAWLVVSSVLVPHESRATVVNNFVVAAGVLAFSLASALPRGRGPMRHSGSER